SLETWTSLSRPVAPNSTASRKASSVFSGASADAPRWAHPIGVRGAGRTAAPGMTAKVHCRPLTKGAEGTRRPRYGRHPWRRTDDRRLRRRLLRGPRPASHDPRPRRHGLGGLHLRGPYVHRVRPALAGGVRPTARRGDDGAR